MTEAQPPLSDWPTCQVRDGCIGVQLDAEDHGCVHHTTDENAQERWWSNLSGGGPLDARGLTFTSEQLDQLLRAAPPNRQNRPQLTRANFEKATFAGPAQFVGATFSGPAVFVGAAFVGPVSGFEGATFAGPAQFVGATFSGPAWFVGATFAGPVWFVGATFAGPAQFLGATFERVARFARATFEGGAQFEDSSFRGQVWLDNLTVEENFRIDGAAFAAMATVTGRIRLLSARGVRFEGRTRLALRGTDVDLAGASFHETALLTTSGIWNGSDDGADDQRSCRLISLEEADVAYLTIAGVDLSPCRFAGAHHLDQLRLEGSELFASAPQGRNRLGRRRWIRRQVIAEEHAWRHHTHKQIEGKDGKAKGWYPPECQPADDLRPPRREPVKIAAIYRDLRKGREDAKDAPGAADFYYGETEMRRHSSQTPRAERLILFLYWLLSGYALRTSRALAALAVVVLVGWLVLWAAGYQDPQAQRPTLTGEIDGQSVEFELADPTTGQPGRGNALLASIESVFRSPRNAEALTTTGRVTTTALRILGPVLVALALLSVRGRVKR